MNQAAHLWLYFLLVFGVVVLPGLDMALVLASAISGGRRAGLAAVTGIMAGGACHTAMGALGVAVVLRMWPQLFNTLLLAGALYIGWIGLGLLRARPAGPMPLPAAARGVGATFLRAILTSLLNPKAYVFMLAVFPQFVRPGAGPVWLQATALGSITAVTQAGVYGTLALVAAQAPSRLADRPSAHYWHRCAGMLLVLSSLAIGLDAWRGT